MIKTVYLPPALLRQVEGEARAAFPRECCGLLAGRVDGGVARIAAVHPVPNLATAADRFEIGPAAQFALLRALRGTDQSVIGCYHSHPGGRPVPSPHDLAGAGEEGFLWLIAAVAKQGAVETAAFCYRGGAFARVNLNTGPA
jgi:proteasome lid subunit RPN8/RPN11